MDASKLRVAFIGAGKQANWRHYPSVASLPDADLVALCDFNEGLAQQTAQRWGIPKVYQDYKKMLDEMAPQAVFIITNPKDIFEPTSYALSKGFNVFIEKPPGLNLNQIQVLAYYAEIYKCLTMVGFQRRFVPAVTALKAKVEERGPLHSVSVANLKSTSDLTKHTGNGILDQITSDGMHSIDNLRWLAGGDVKRVESHVRTIYIPGPVANDVMAQVEFSNGVIGHLQYSLVTGGAPQQAGATAPGFFRTEIHGKNITASIDADRQSYIVADSNEPESFDSKSFGSSAGNEPEHYLGFWHQIRHFVDCVKQSREPSSNFADAVKTWELIHRIYESAGT